MMSGTMHNCSGRLLSSTFIENLDELPDSFFLLTVSGPEFESFFVCGFGVRLAAEFLEDFCLVDIGRQRRKERSR